RTRLLDPRLLAAMPEPVSLDTLGDGTTILIESMLPGELAWRGATGTRSKGIYGEALDFLATLRGETVQPATSDGRSLIEPDLVRIAASPLLVGSLRESLAMEMERAASLLSDGGIEPHASHGDFGYGNILVDPDSGRLRGVIDWDTARIV